MKTVLGLLIIALLFAGFGYFITRKDMKPMVLLQDIAWSFAEPTPATPEALISAIEKYNAKIKRPVNKQALTTLSAFTRLDVEYEYAVQKQNGQWERIHAVVNVGDGTRSLSYADILWKLHTEAHKNLADQDAHYFEGLALMGKEINSGVPAYEVHLGS